MEGALLATLVVFLFLHIFRATFIILLAIPTCLMSTFLFIRFFGFTINVMTLMGLALSVGILVDDSIVVLENIFRHLVMGKPPRKAALDGRMEIGGAAVAITLTDVVVFVPIAFMGGIVGQFFRDFGITVATVTLLSLFVGFTLTPMLASRWMKTSDVLAAEGIGEKRKGFWAAFFRGFDAAYKSLEETYRGVLKWALKHRWLVILAGNGILILSLLITPFLGFEFMTQSDEGAFALTVEMPVGTAVHETSRITTMIEKKLFDKKKYPEVQTIYTNVGSVESMMGASDQGPQYAQVQIQLVEKSERKRSVFEIEKQLAVDVADIPGATIRMQSSQHGSGMAPVYIELQGADTDTLVKYAAKVKKVVDSTKGTRDSDISQKTGKPELQIYVDRLKAAQYGVSIAQIAMTLRNSVEGNSDYKYREKGDEYDIRIRLPEQERKSKEDMENMMLGGAMGKNVLLKDVATVVYDVGPTKLERKNRQRLVKVTAYLETGYQLGNISNQINAELQKMDRPAGVTVYFGGEAENMRDSAGNMGSAMLLAVLLVYMLMSALFESLLYPFIIMFSLPQALVGALWALFLTNKTLSIISMIGIIMLVGLVTKNAILLVDYTNTLRKRGKKRDEAILEAGPTRLRPIIMTTMTVVLGNLPMALGLGSGAEMRSPMSVAVIGGLLLSLFLTLLIIPCTYTIMDDLAKKISGKKKDDDTFDGFVIEDQESDS
ncbi:MAG TPA: efflux RND transporter permease subunit, partial [bacterium]|nr:efflux RND transporter permease subunit [bacterium]